MKKIKVIFILFICLLIFPAYRYYSDEDRQRISRYIIPCPVIAEVIEATPIYNYHDETSGRIGLIEKGKQVEIVQDRSAEWYRVKILGEENTAWVKRQALDIPKDEEPSGNLLTKEQLEEYMNFMEYESQTNYFVLTDIYRQMTYVFKGNKGNWTLEKTMVCSTGKNESPTTRGTFKLSERGEWFYSERLNSGSMYWVRFNKSYLFHSVAMDKDRNIIDNVIGDRRSMGCIRLELDDARWFFNNVPEKTTVIVT